MPRIEGWLLTPFRAAVHEATRTAVIADLHLGYAAARRAGGEALPAELPGPMAARLEALVATFKLDRLIIAGDLVERGVAGQGAAAAFVRRWSESGLELHLVAGNHDRRLADLPGLARDEELEWAGARIVHYDDAPAARLTLMGHLHPALRDRRRWGQAACYLHLERRLMLPAQSDDAAGVNVLGLKEFAAARCYAISEGETLDLGPVAELKRQLGGAPRPARRVTV